MSLISVRTGAPAARPRLIALVALTALIAPAARAQTLTDITLFRLDTANNTIGEGFNTRGNETSVSNLYLLSGGSFVNSGNAAATSIAINLSAPGTYIYTFAGDNVNTNTGTALGINFFFNGNAATPGISARGTAVTNNAGIFIANGGTTNTPTFFGAGGTVAGANTLSFVSGGNLVTLSAFTYNTISGADQVQSFDNTPGGTPDTTGSFTVTVRGAATAPEPASLALLLPTVPAIGLALRRRRKASGTGEEATTSASNPA